MIELRTYQQECVDALFRYFECADGHPLAEMPTACHAPGTRVLDWRGRPVAVEDFFDRVRLIK